jgi:glycosyltransferase involved in cell wall biosynthesis
VSRRPRIVHVIDSLVRGGAETLLVGLLPLLAADYEVILVTLTADTDFPPESIVCAERHCLGFTGSKSIPRCALALRRIIARTRPHLVRAQLFASSLVARLATPASVPLVFSIHSAMSKDAYEKNRLALPIERLTYRRRHALIAVSQDALADFDRHVGIKGKAFVLHNMIDDAFFESARAPDSWQPGMPLRLVAVGNLKAAKNYALLVEAFRALAGAPVSLDIYGEGPLRADLEAAIGAHALPIRLKGLRSDIAEILAGYDAYVMPSLYEGFGIAAAEAMASGLPMLLSDLPVLRELSHGNALFFDPHQPPSFAALVGDIVAGRADIAALSARGREIAGASYRRAAYVAKLKRIYEEVMGAPAGGARS